MANENRQVKGRLSLGLSLFIALCLVVLFCIVSISIARNINGLTQAQTSKYLKIVDEDDEPSASETWL